MPNQLRELFVMLIIWSKITIAPKLFKEFQVELSEDHAHRLPQTVTVEERNE